MIDFVKVAKRTTKQGGIEIYPNFIMNYESQDLMIRGGDFYAVWVEERGLWSTSEQDVIRLVDQALDAYAEKERDNDRSVRVLHMWDADSGSIDRWHKYCQKQMRDNYVMLDEKLIFSNSGVNKSDYASKRLPYPLEDGDCPAFNELLSTLYSDGERHKIEWAIGAIVSGESKTLQKFLVLYGAPGTGKGTVISIIQKLFQGYCTSFDAKALGSSNDSFALAPFKSNPLVGIQNDGDLSRIEDNTRLNSLVSHEEMVVNEKFKAQYAAAFKTFLFMGTNRPVRITDAKSGLIRRLIDVSPTGNKIDKTRYDILIKQVDFELGAIAKKCLSVFEADPMYYNNYIPINMMSASNDFYNFVLNNYTVFRDKDATTLKAAWEAYNTYCDMAKVPKTLPMRVIREELKNYFREYSDRCYIDGERVSGYYSGFRCEQFEEQQPIAPAKSKKPMLVLDKTVSLLDIALADCPAQYASTSEKPTMKWDSVGTTLKDLDTRQLHYVKLTGDMTRLITVDFDFKKKNGEKDREKNLVEAAKWPATYAEFSKGGGVHLEYIYDGDVSKLSHIYDENIEIKTQSGNSSLRRKLTFCNDIQIATISSGLPLKGDDKVLNGATLKSEKSLRVMIMRNLEKEFHGATKPSVDFIYKILEDAYSSGMKYDVSDMYDRVVAFAAGSTHQAETCLKTVAKMKFKSEEPSENTEASGDDSDIVFYDVEVFPNLFLVNYKMRGTNGVHRMINPASEDIEKLIKFKLVGFNNRRYDNHMLYARLIGYSNEQLYGLSQKIINDKRSNALFGEAFNLSYTDIYDFASKKQSLKKWEIELGIHHKELGLPWDQPVPEERWVEVAEYCDADVLATEAVFEHLQGDWTARKILAKLAGMTVNDTTNSLTTRIIFGREKHPQLIYTDLSETFPGYEFTSDRKNMYRGTDVGMGGYILSHAGIYRDVALLDVASLHPNSIRAMNCFGEYTKRFTDILDARVAIKHGDFDTARAMMDGKLAPYLEDESTADQLAQALKIAINSVYGLTAASFENPFRDPRNKNNIVALRGALFMRTLQDEVESQGYDIVAIKTDSIKIANANPEIVDFCIDFAKQYGYTFEFEAFYDRICQVNDADYIARYKDAESCQRIFDFIPKDNKKHPNEWTVTGAKFAVPYIFKTLFAHENIGFDDLCETKSCTTALYLDMNEGLADDEHNYIFIGKVGRFTPIAPGFGGGLLYREKDGKYNAVSGTKGYRWMESEMVQTFEKEGMIDMGYFRTQAEEAREEISQYGDFEWFVSDDENGGLDNEAADIFNKR